MAFNKVQTGQILKTLGETWTDVWLTIKVLNERSRVTKLSETKMGLKH